MEAMLPSLTDHRMLSSRASSTANVCLKGRLGPLTEEAPREWHPLAEHNPQQVSWCFLRGSPRRMSYWISLHLLQVHLDLNSTSPWPGWTAQKANKIHVYPDAYIFQSINASPSEEKKNLTCKTFWAQIVFQGCNETWGPFLGLTTHSTHRTV